MPERSLGLCSDEDVTVSLTPAKEVDSHRVNSLRRVRGIRGEARGRVTVSGAAPYLAAPRHLIRRFI
jgi:hypothetical protein